MDCTPSDRNPVEILDAWLLSDFGTLAGTVRPLCLTDGGTEPLLFDVFAAVRRVVCLSALAHQVAEDIQCGYVYLAAYYFSVDALVDRDERWARCGREAIAPLCGLLLHAASRRLSRGAASVQPLLVDYLQTRLNELLSENAIALASEQEFI